MNNDIQPIIPGDSQIVLYQPNETLSLEVKIDDALNTGRLC